jgi:hypothetical protein
VGGPAGVVQLGLDFGPTKGLGNTAHPTDVGSLDLTLNLPFPRWAGGLLEVNWV